MLRALLPAVFLLTSAFALSALAADPVALKPTNLRCENLANPTGLDVKDPRLSWLLESDQRGQKQTAYRILVASNDETLAADKGDLWDSGQVASDQISQIVYAGKPLASHQVAFWKVQVFDKDKKPSPWSEPARWTMGLTNLAAEWKAQWIGYDKPRNSIELPDAPLDGAKWIWVAGERGDLAPKGNRVFMTSFTVPDGAKVAKAEVTVAADDRYWFVINGQQVAASPDKESATKSVHTIDVTARIKPGKNFIRAQVENYEFGPAGLIAKLVITAGDKPVTVVTDDSWHGTDNPGANWHNRDIADDAWPKAAVTGDYGAQPWGKLKAEALRLPPPALLRSNFNVGDKPIKRAVLYATALGLYDLSINGKHVDEDRYGPGWTDYNKRVYYRVYDVTKLLKDGDNAFGCVLADGWYSGYVGYGGHRDHYGKNPRFAAQLHVEYDGAPAMDFTTGPDWKASTGAIQSADFLMGELVDAAKAVEDWDQPYFEDKGWEKVDVGAEVSPVIQHHPGPPVVQIFEFPPAAVTEPKPGVFVLDMGQNFAGYARLKLPKTEAGQKITLRFAERLNPDGTIYTTNLRSARSTDVYTSKGGAVTWEPRFTFHGFQYVEVTGLKEKPAEGTVTGIAISSDTPVVGSFLCSDPTLTKLHNNIYWTQRANFIDIPTDCPQRDERLGWTGDAQVYVRTASLNCDVEAFFTKWLVDLEDGQRGDGQFPMVAPVKVAGDDGGPAWADAGVICPWTIFEVYGDKRLLAARYDSMVKFVEFCRKRSTPELLPPKQYHCFGDWLSIGADTPKDVIYIAYFAKSTRLVAKAAHALGKADDEKKYEDLFQKIKAAFNLHFVNDQGQVLGNTQCGYVLAIAFDLLDTERQAQAAKWLTTDIEKRGWHLSTGFIGTKDLMLALSKIGRADVAYRLLHQDTFPSWNFSIKHGATSIWERWDGWTPERGFQDPGMNSFAHYSFGAVYGWMVENIGGIKSDGPAYSQLLFEPQLDPRLKWAKTSYRSPRGRIATAWTLEGEKYTYDVTVPPGVMATVSLPTKDGKITESGKPIDAAEGATLMRTVNDRAQITIGSGTYKFATMVRVSAQN
jgi:alpha-L-rhamnosidase